MSAVPHSIVFELIRSDHGAVREQVELALQAHDVGQRQRMRDELCSLLRGQLESEEQVLYPQLRQVETLVPFMNRMAQQHDAIRNAMSELIHASVDRGRFDDALECLRGCCNDHFEEEERSMFPMATEHLAGELPMIAIELQVARDQAHGAFGVG